MSVLQVDSVQFQSEVLHSDIPVLVDFYAPWCGHCKRLIPVLDELAKEYEGKIKVVKINVDENHELAVREYGVMGLPTMLLIKNDKVVEKLIGFQPKQKIVDKIIQYIMQP